MTNKLLTKDTWELLAAEYLPWDVYRGPHHCSNPGPEALDEGAVINWAHLLNHVYDNTSSSLVPEGERGGIVSTWIGERQLDWEPRTDADNIVTSFGELFHQAWVAPTDGLIPLSDLHHNHPYFTRADNLVFRAWHDTAHLANACDFTHDGELRLYGLQAQKLGNFARDALFCESVYQLAASVVLGGYPEHQYCRRLGPVGKAVRDLLIGLV